MTAIEPASAELIRFPRGFFWTNQSRPAPPHYRHAKFPGLRVAPNTIIQEGAYGGIVVAIVGLCVHTNGNLLQPASPIDAVLRAAKAGDEDLFDLLDTLCGKFAVFVHSDRRTVVFHDAAATRSVFYRRDFTAVASHARLISDMEKSTLPFRGAYPGNATPYPDVKILTANNAIDVGASRTFRYWPRQALARQNVQSAALKMTALGVSAVNNLPPAGDIRLALTAGLDSRTSLALLKRSGRNFTTFTYNTRAKEDVIIPLLLSRLNGTTHSYVATLKAEEYLRSAIDEVSYFRSTAHAIAGCRRFFSAPNPIAIISNVFEIGQGYYQKIKGAVEPRDPRSMQELFASRQFGKAAEIEEYSAASFYDESLAHFEEMYAETDFGSAALIVDPSDLFYWEHRMTSWHSTQMLERDFYAEGFIPLNSRAAIAEMLSVPLEDRIACTVFEKVIAEVDKELLDIPFNPKRASEIARLLETAM